MNHYNVLRTVEGMYGVAALGGAAGVPAITDIFTSAGPAVGGLGNIATRMQIGVDNEVLIAGFIVQGSASKQVLIRAAGPSLPAFGVTGAIANPRLELHNSAGTIGTNDDWKTTQLGGVITADQVSDIQSSGLAPRNLAEPALIATLPPGGYTAIVQGADGGSGVGTAEVYDLNPGNGSKLANISSRGFVKTLDKVMIGGLIVTGSTPEAVLIRGIGPSLTASGIAADRVLRDPTLELHDANGAVIRANDNWTATQQSEIQGTGLAPKDQLEAAILVTLTAGNYTAIVQGQSGGTGIGLVEVYELRNLVVLATGLTFQDGTAGGQSTGAAVGKILANGDSIFWFDYNQAGGATGGAIRSVPIAGGPVKNLVTGLGGVNGLAVDNTNIYWTEFNIGSGSGSIKSLPKTGGGLPIVLATGHPATAGGGTSAFDVFFPLTISVDPNFVYWGEQVGGGAVRRVPKGGGAVTDLGRGLGFSSALNDGSFFYEVGSQQVRRMPMSGASVDVLANYTSNNPFLSPQLDANAIYWTELTAPNGKLNVLPKAGGTVTTLVSGLNNPHSTAVDDKFAYYNTSPGQGPGLPTISRVPKAGGTTEVFYSFVSTSNNPSITNQAPVEYLASDLNFIYGGLFDPHTTGQGAVISISK